MRMRWMRAAVSGLAVSLSAVCLAVPPVADRVPENATLVILTPSMDRLDAALKAMTTNLEMPVPFQGLQDLMMMGGVQKGVDMTKGAAIFTMAEKFVEGEDVPPMIAVIPTADFAGLVGNFGATAADGFAEATLGDSKLFFKDVGGGYAAVGQVRDLVAGFAATTGQATKHDKALGAACRELAESGDLVIIARGSMLRDTFGPQLAEMADGAAEQAAGMGIEVDAAKGGEAARGAMDDARVGVLAFRADNKGISIDAAAAFNEGSEMATTFARAGNAETLLGKLPAQPYLLAMAADGNHPLGKGMIEVASMFPGFMNQPEMISGHAMSVGFTQGALMGPGLLSGTVAYVQTDKPDAYLEAVKTSTTAMQGSYEANATNPAGIEASSYQAKVEADPSDAQSAMLGSMLFGQAGGPNGYFTKVNGGLMQTMARNSALLATATGSAKGEKSFTADAVVSEISRGLPKGQVVTVFVDIRNVWATVQPMMAMMGGGPEVDMPDSVPPLAFSLSSGEGSGRISVYLPMPLAKVIWPMVRSSLEDGMFGPAEDEEEAPRF